MPINLSGIGPQTGPLCETICFHRTELNHQFRPVLVNASGGRDLWAIEVCPDYIYAGTAIPRIARVRSSWDAKNPVIHNRNTLRSRSGSERIWNWW